MTFDELMKQVLSILPDAIVDEKDGEIVISTGMSLGENDELVNI